jgi:hypothetical protein
MTPSDDIALYNNKLYKKIENNTIRKPHSNIYDIIYMI